MWRLSWTDLATIYGRPERTYLAALLEAHQAPTVPSPAWHSLVAHLARFPNCSVVLLQSERADFQVMVPPWKELYLQHAHIALEDWRQVPSQTRPDERVRETLRDIWGLKSEKDHFSNTPATKPLLIEPCDHNKKWTFVLDVEASHQFVKVSFNVLKYQATLLLQV